MLRLADAGPRERPNRVIVRVTPLAPGFAPGEPQEYAARMVHPELTTAVGRGLSVGQAVDCLMRAVEWSVIVDVAPAPAARP